ncbi:MAG: hypothetical protein RIS25_1180 [Actinomycetota bacterium]|jgi:RimJ/RimL family protein N-acetyltransferase
MVPYTRKVPAFIPPHVNRYGFGLILEPFTESHLDDLFAAIAHPEVFDQGFGGGPAALTLTAPDFAAWALRHFQWESSHVYVVRRAVGPFAGAIVGITTLGDFDTSREHAHIFSSAFAPYTWGSAINPASKLMLLDAAFDAGFGRVKIQADAVNVRSRRAIEALGATFEGTVRRDKQRLDGSWRDTALYSIVVDEWATVRERLVSRIELRMVREHHELR